MASFSGISTALQSLLTEQAAIDVINHNVANANTTGYHRQDVELSAGPTSGTPSFNNSTIMSQIGTGVVLTGIKRYSDSFTDVRYWQETAEYSKWNMQKAVLSQVESTEAETSTDGLSTKLDNFWAAWKNLSTTPEDTSLRANLLQTGKDLASAFNTRYTNLTQIQKDLDNTIVQNVDEINTIATKIAQLNAQISRYSNSSSSQANDFLDQQQTYLDRLAQLSDAKITTQANGQVMVSIGGHMLVQGTTTLKLNTVVNPNNGNMRDVKWADGQSFNPPSGEMAGILNVRDTVIKDEKTKLNNLAATVFSSVNQIHEAGYGLDDAVPSATTTGSGTAPSTYSATVDITYTGGSLIASGVGVSSMSGSPNVYSVDGTQISVDTSSGSPIFSVNGNTISTSGSATLTVIGSETFTYSNSGLFDNGSAVSSLSGSPNNYSVGGSAFSINSTGGSTTFAVAGTYPTYPYSAGSPVNPVGRDFFVVSGTTGYQSGWDSSGSPTNSIYTAPSMIDLALSISVNPELDNVRNIAVAKDPKVSGDGRNAEALYALQTGTTVLKQINEGYPASGGSPIINQTDTSGSAITDNIDAYNSQRVTELGLTIQNADSMTTQHNNLLTVLSTDRESVGGVNLDEEAANLIKYQQAYNASIRMMTAVDDMLDRVINNMGKAGL